MPELPQDNPYPDRWDRGWITKREQLEAGRIAHSDTEEPGNAFPMPVHYRFLKWFLKTIRLYERGYRNFLDIQVNYVAHRSIFWPVPLSGLRILHISDLHIDLDSGLMDPLCRLLPELHCDLVVFTGDFWEGVRQSTGTTMSRLERILDCLPEHRFGKFGVLGNHDSVELAAAIERAGVRILVNEAVEIETPKGALTLAGVDDAVFFELHDMAAALEQCPAGQPKILLSHSPQLAAEAEQAGYAAMLSGHTHGGQICLPGGTSPVTMEGIPTKIFKGLWRVGNLSGYTSSGAGACQIPVRFNCPPEVTIHTLNNSGQR